MGLEISLQYCSSQPYKNPVIGGQQQEATKVSNKTKVMCAAAEVANSQLQAMRFH